MPRRKFPNQYVEENPQSGTRVPSEFRPQIYMNAQTKPKVVVFSDHLLYPSETFIRAQGLALAEFERVFAGSRLVPGGLELPVDRTYVISQGGIAGRIHEGAFKLFG